MIASRILAALILLLAGMPSTSPAESRSFKRYPFMPSLLESQDEELCGVVLEDARERFLSGDVAPTMIGSGREHFRWLDWTAVGKPEDPKPHGKWTSLELDLDGTGDKQALLQLEVQHSWRGENYYAFVFPSRKVAEEVLRQVPPPSPGATTDPPRIEGGTMFHPEAAVVAPGGSSRLFLNEWSPSSLFEFKGRYYFYGNEGQLPLNFGESIGLFRLRSDGRAERRCVVKGLPGQERRRALLAVPGVGSYLKVLAKIGGASGGDTGSAAFGAWHDQGAIAATERAAYRPWATSRRFEGISVTYYVYGPTPSFMQSWSFQDVWSRREYQTCLEHGPAARRGLVSYFRKEFGLGREDAKEWGNRVFEEMTAAWFLIPKDYGNLDVGFIFAGAADPVMRAILEGSSERVAELVAGFSARDKDRSEHAPRRFETRHLLAAAESPEFTRLILDFGVEVDAADEYGKTALMTAAHMNRPDVVRLLLERKADPNCRTQRGRTALMYAAENAGPEVIKLLLDAGADPEAQDGGGHGMISFQQKNPWLAPEQRRGDIRTVAESASREPKGPGFDCRKATTAAERLICGDEVLRMQDGALAAAFARWLTLGGGAEAKSEQRRWLRERDDECLGRSRADQVPCLQQKTRSRIRYLHNRIAELEEPESRSRK